jgi:hypothetical protein
MASSQVAQFLNQVLPKTTDRTLVLKAVSKSTPTLRQVWYGAFQKNGIQTLQALAERAYPEFKSAVYSNTVHTFIGPRTTVVISNTPEVPGFETAELIEFNHVPTVAIDPTNAQAIADFQQLCKNVS